MTMSDDDDDNQIHDHDNNFDDDEDDNSRRALQRKAEMSQPITPYLDEIIAYQNQLHFK